MKKTLIGVVAASSQAKTLRVEIERKMKHPKYGKIIRGRTVCHVHDEDGKAKKGDTVEIAEAPSLSTEALGSCSRCCCGVFQKRNLTAKVDSSRVLSGLGAL